MPLVVELAYDMSAVDVVIFIDAMRNGESPFYFSELKGADESTGFGSHTLTPNALKTSTNTVYSASPECYMLGIRGHQFDEKLSAQAESNLLLAVDFIIDLLKYNTQSK